MAKCPCGSGNGYDDCCGPIIEGAPAATPEALMRSRYTAYVRGELEHIERTHASEVRASYNRSAAESTASSVEWIGLAIGETTGGGEGDDAGTVEFHARFIKDGRENVHHERSNFRREDGNWAYVDGKMNPGAKPVRVEKTGRNEPCPCGSGKKYKKCCGG